ncbi:SusC/RagA family TonB-linked outer membrane protein [Rhodohalobacter sp. 614A]|uniref:SusC/RagA family TonB-linked outer membrane protein n=1 Tax=Rhodohalobacter sp. 614A TaxID=2908649 RepID=UPI001F290F0B|nr:SusC/RagA family TonB-linked outer membrane protein [Rhodohalobacter sp. 614A]
MIKKIQFVTVKKVLCVLMLLIGLHTNLLAQQMVTGTVLDESNMEPLPGVSILIQGTNQGTATDLDGRYSLEVPSEDAVLIFTFIGYERQEIAIQGRSEIDVHMVSQAVVGDEVVVVGYGTQRREDLTSSVSTVSTDEFVQASARSAAEMIQGQTAGLIVTTSSGNPRDNGDISLRGITTINSSSEPLILIDGVPGSLNTIAPEDIESVDILKDGSAAAIYGSRGQNGVILISTRKSTKGQPPTLQYSGYVNTQTIYNKPDMLDANDYRRLIDEGVNFTDYGSSTDWQDEIMQTPFGQTHNLTLMGGSAQTSYTASLNYKNWEGIFLTSNDNNLIGRININHSMLEGKLDANVNLIANRRTYDDSFGNYDYRQALIRNPTDIVTDENGTWIERDGFNYDNPVARIEETNSDVEERELRLNGTLTLNPIENLSLSLLGSTTLFNRDIGYSRTFEHTANVTGGEGGYASRSLDSSSENLVEFTATYENQIDAHDFSILGGYSWQETIYDGFGANNRRFATDLFSYNNLGIGNGLSEGEAGMGSYKNSSKLIGFFGRLNYIWNRKYLLMGSLRYEGNSKFGENHKWGLFPAISAGWRISEESFMDEVDIISDLKVRAGFGVTGVAPDDPYLSLTSFSYGSRFFNNGQWIQGISPARNPNPDLRWEQKEEINVGVDFSLFDDRLSGTYDIYRRDTRDMLWNYSVPVPPYLYNNILANVGHIRNYGMEASLKAAAVQKQDFSWNTSVNYSTNSNRLISLSNELFDLGSDYFYPGHTGEPIQVTTHRVEIGGPVGNFYGWDSVDITEEGEWIIQNNEGERIPASEAGPGDRTILGNGIPDHFLSWNNNFRFKNFDLNVTMYGAFGHQILNFQRLYYENPRVIQYNMLETAFDDVYGKARLNQDLAYVSYYIEDGDYWKLDNVTLGYSFDLNNLGITQSRVYVSGGNLLTITGYKGMDPEVGINGLDPGTDHRDKFPTTRTFTLGVNLTF